MGLTPERGTRVTCEDEDGHQETVVIEDDWLLITDGAYELVHVNKFSNGTAVITVKRTRVDSRVAQGSGPATGSSGQDDPNS